jgi:hypothetical protein
MHENLRLNLVKSHLELLDHLSILLQLRAVVCLLLLTALAHLIKLPSPHPLNLGVTLLNLSLVLCFDLFFEIVIELALHLIELSALSLPISLLPCVLIFKLSQPMHHLCSHLTASLLCLRFQSRLVLHF